MACAGLTPLTLTIGFLIAPSMQHRIVERGQDSSRILMVATTFGGLALLPLSIALAFDAFTAVAQVAERTWAAFIGGGFLLAAVSFWHVLEFAIRRKRQPVAQTKPSKPTPIADKVDQLLTEARVIIPGAQALFGFQLSITLMRAFQQLPVEAKVAHVAALCCIGLAVILLMAPASLHRISFAGDDDPAFVKIGSIFVLTAPVPLAFGIAFDTYVAVGRAIHSDTVAITLAIVAIIALLGLWYGLPIVLRLVRRPTRT